MATPKIVNIMDSGLAGQAQSTAAGDRATRVVTVLLDRPSTDVEVNAMPGVPEKDSLHPTAKWLWVVDRRVKSLSPYLFEIELDYEGGTGTSSDARTGAGTSNPLLRPAQYEFDYQTSSEPVDADYNGLPYVNANGEGFNPPIHEEFHDRIIRITRNEATVVGGENYDDVLNADTWWGREPGTCRIMPYRSDLVVEGRYIYQRVRREIIIRRKPILPDGTPLGWRRRILNSSRNLSTTMRDPVKGNWVTKLHKIVDADGIPATEPVPITFDGKGTSAGGLPSNEEGRKAKTYFGVDVVYGKNNVCWLLFERKPREPFGSLRLI